MKECAPNFDPDVVEFEGEVLPSYSGQNGPFFTEGYNDDQDDIDNVFRDYSDLEIRCMEIQSRHAINTKEKKNVTKSQNSEDIGGVSDEDYIRDLHDELPSDDNRSMWQ